jgi:membrane-associated phospholipid phosphatase
VIGRRNLLDPAPDGLAENVADRYRDHRRLVVAMALVVVGYVVLTGFMVVLGLLLVDVLGHGALGSFDHHVTNWFAHHRTGGLNQTSRFATDIANTDPVVAMALLVTVVLLVTHHVREALFLASALVLEVTVFLTVNLIIDRPRPDVPRLGVSPGTSSYPSGHMAASTVFWVGLAIVVSVLGAALILRVIAYVLAVFVPLTVAFSRVYRGMHFPSDVFAGAVLALLALAVACAIARVWEAMSQRSVHESTPGMMHQRPERRPQGLSGVRSS